MPKWLTVFVLVVSASAVFAADAIPPAVDRKVDFEKDVAPILQTSCMQCHANGKYEADLSIESREKLLTGGGTGPAIVLGKSADSLLIQLVSGVEPDSIMPKKGKRLTPEQIGILRAWIDQDATWPKGYVLHDANKPIPAKLEPRNVPVPAASGDLTNPIDRLLAPYLESHHAKLGAPVDDRAFARRVYLDIIGRLPPTDELGAFVTDSNPQKRAELVKRLLADDDRYAAHWMSFWNDMLRNDYKGTGYIDGGRLQITRWLYVALKKNMPYDEFVRQLVTGASGAQGFTKGIVWRGVVNAAQTPPMQAAQNIGQVFMGVNLKCASCHDSFISQWKLTDCYGLAGVFADKPPEMERCSKPLGQTASMKFLYPELGSIDQSAPREKRIEQLASIVTSEKNGRLSRTIVNRIWQRLMGRGIIEPVDEMDNKPWNADLLDALAWQFVHDQHYDLKQVIAQIVMSRAYQAAIAPASDERAKDYVFTGPSIKRMTAEQFVDAVAQLSGVYPAKMDAQLTDVAEKYAKTRWIWSDKKGIDSAAPGKLYLRRVVPVKRDLASIEATIAADNYFTLFINGKEVARGDDWGKPAVIDLKPYLVTGKNIFAAVVENISDVPNPAGFWLHADAKYAEKDDRNRDGWALNSDKSWKWSKAKPAENWTTEAFNDSAWPAAVEIGDLSSGPWKVKEVLPSASPMDNPPEIRAALCAADPLTTALGRPNRDQVNTVRPSSATTLMALELTNGGTLTDLLAKSAKKMATEKDVNADVLINQIYAKAFSRAPTKDEAATAKEIVGANVVPEGVEDFLWAVVMLPEFQLIR